jgi:hypothetical protein
MRSHGVSDYPDPTTNPGGGGGGFNLGGLNTNTPTFKAANQTCKSLLPSGSSSNPAQNLAQSVKLAECMRSHGLANFPDPNGQGAFDFNGIDMTSPRFQSSLKACRTSIHFQGAIPVESGNKG